MSKFSVLLTNWLLIIFVPLFITACATTNTKVSTHVEPPPQVYFPDSSEPMLHAKLGKLQIKPITREVVKVNYLKNDLDRGFAESELRKGLNKLFNSPGLFESSTRELINVVAVPVSLSVPIDNVFTAVYELAVEYAFRAEDGTLLVEEKIVSQGKETGSWTENLKTAISSNVTKFSYAIREKLPVAWNSYTGRRDATHRQIATNLRKENRYFRVITSKAVVRDNPDAQAREILILPQADLVHVTGALPSGWLQVSREGQPIGWVHSTLLREDFASAPTYHSETPPKISVPAVSTTSIPTDMTDSSFDFGSYHALIIGNNDYKHLPELQTAVNDAQTMAGLLQTGYGFSVRLLRNGTRA